MVADALFVFLSHIKVVTKVLVAHEAGLAPAMYKERGRG